MDFDYENDSYYEGRLNCTQIVDYLSFLSDPFYREPQKRTFITTLYSCVACVGAIGNCMVIAAVLRNAQMRTPRNYFIINLALSDLLMCILTVPFTMYYVLNQFWDLGSTACKIVASAQGVNIFVSTMSITAIGLDRYWVILFPTKTQQQRFVIAICFFVIWIFSLLLAFPLFYATDATLPDNLKDTADQCGIILFVCSENWDKMVLDRGAYSISSTVFQYVLPLTMLTFVYTRIIWRLGNRMVHRQRASTPSERSIGGNHAANNRRAYEQRQRRMNMLLICLVAFFAVCWLPLNVYNALSSFDLAQYNVVVFVICHAFGMTSACANPILYGVFNENFRTEFIAILTFLKIVPVCRFLAKKLLPGCYQDTGDNGSNGITVTTSVVNARTEISDHESIRAVASAPAMVSNFKKLPRGNVQKNKKSAKFKKFKDFNEKFETVGLPETKNENGCSKLPILDKTRENSSKFENEILFRGDVAQSAAATPEAENQLISEEKIPLFSGKSMNTVLNLKSYMINTNL